MRENVICDAVYIHFPDRSYNTSGGQEEGWGI